MTAIAVNSSNTQEIYLGTAQGGVWKTLDGGNHWTPLMDQQDSLAVGAITISPDGHTVYVGTGEGNHGGDNYAGIGLLKSTNEGKTWSVLGATYFKDSAITSIIVDPSNANNILVSTTWAVLGKGLIFASNQNGLGVFLTTDGGSTWTLTLQGSSNTDGIAQMVTNSTNSSIIFASDFAGVIWQSTSFGSQGSWTNYIHVTSASDQGRVAMAVTPANSNLLYGVFVNSTGEIAFSLVYDSSAPSNSAFTYFNNLPDPTNLQYGPCGGQCWYDLTINVDPIDVNTIYIGTNNLYKTIDGGTTWTFLGGAEQNGNLLPDMHAFAFAPNNHNIIYSGNDGGIYKSTNGGSTWSSLNTNLGTIQFDSIAASPTDDTHLLGGVQDNACDIYTNSTSWTISASGDGAASLFINDTALICNYVNVGFRISLDNGQSFINFNDGLNTNDPSEFYAPMTQDPNDPWTMYYGTNRIYKITADATAWTDISGQLSAGTITTIAVAKSNNQTIYEGDSKGIVKMTTNGGTSWA